MAPAEAGRTAPAEAGRIVPADAGLVGLCMPADDGRLTFLPPAAESCLLSASTDTRSLSFLLFMSRPGRCACLTDAAVVATGPMTSGWSWPWAALLGMLAGVGRGLVVLQGNSNNNNNTANLYKR